MKKIIVYFVSFILIILFAMCDGPFLAEQKSGVPSDHISNKHGFMHKSNADTPFEYDPITGTMNCANSDCHGEDLRGSIAFAEGKNNYAPSCYQCHDKKWNDLSNFNKLEIQK